MLTGCKNNEQTALDYVYIAIMIFVFWILEWERAKTYCSLCEMYLILSLMEFTILLCFERITKETDEGMQLREVRHLYGRVAWYFNETNIDFWLRLMFEFEDLRKT